MVHTVESPYQFYSSALKRLGNIGIPVSNNYSADFLGFPRRIDQIEGNYKEGSLMGPIESVIITKNKDYTLYLDIFNTVAASAHTLFTVPYEIFEPTWRKYMQFYCNEQGIEVPEQNTPLVRGAKSTKNEIIPPDHIPLHLLTWCYVRKVDNNTHETSYEAVDFDDLMGVNFQERKNYQKLPERYELDSKQFESGVKDAIDTLKRRNNLQAHAILELYNNTILPVLNDALVHAPAYLHMHIKRLLEPLTLEEIATYFASGFYRDPEMNGYDGLGGGPQSNEALHWHALRLPDFMSLADILGHKKGQPVNAEVQHLIVELAEYLSAAVPQAKGILSYLDKVDVDVEAFVKQTDYYSTAFFALFHDWMDERIYDSLNMRPTLMGTGCIIEEFISHSDSKDVEARFAEGWKIMVPNGVFSDVMIALKPFFQNIHNLWLDGQDALKSLTVENNTDLFDSLASEYQLSDEVIETLKSLRPTQKQLSNWLGEKTDNEHLNKVRARIDRFMESARKRKDIARMAQLFTLQGLFNPKDKNDKSSLYNIPGVPSFGITYERDEQNNLIVYIGPLLSLKGLAEQYGGLMLQRDTGQKS